MNVTGKCKQGNGSVAAPLTAEISEIPLEPTAHIDTNKMMSAFEEYFHQAKGLTSETRLDNFKAMDDNEQAIIICVTNALLDKPNFVLNDADKANFRPQRIVDGRVIATSAGFMPYLRFVDAAIRRGREISAMESANKRNNQKETNQ